MNCKKNLWHSGADQIEAEVWKYQPAAQYFQILGRKILFTKISTSREEDESSPFKKSKISVQLKCLVNLLKLVDKLSCYHAYWIVTTDTSDVETRHCWECLNRNRYPLHCWSSESLACNMMPPLLTNVCKKKANCIHWCIFIKGVWRFILQLSFSLFIARQQS